jgi:hypothetical protein
MSTNAMVPPRPRRTAAPSATQARSPYLGRAHERGWPRAFRSGRDEGPAVVVRVVIAAPPIPRQVRPPPPVFLRFPDLVGPVGQELSSWRRE